MSTVLLQDDDTLLLPALGLAVKQRVEQLRLRHLLDPLFCSASSPAPITRAWSSLSSGEQNQRVAAILPPQSGPVPAYVERVDLALHLINIAGRISWKFTRFEQVLLDCFRLRHHLDPRISLSLTQITAFLVPADVAYAFVSVFGPERLTWEA